MQAVKEFVNCNEYGSPIDFHLESYDTIEVKIPSEIYGWVVEIGEKESLVDYKVSVNLRVQYTIAK